MNPYTNVCTRCGKERIISRVWKEKVGFSIVENTDRVCPDKACQKEVEKELNKQKRKKAEMTQRWKERSLKARRKKVK